MPLYEYICPACNTRFEELVSLTSQTSPTCQVRSPRLPAGHLRHLGTAPRQTTLPSFKPTLRAARRGGIS
jgi:hypothetical protein